MSNTTTINLSGLFEFGGKYYTGKICFKNRQGAAYLTAEGSEKVTGLLKQLMKAHDCNCNEAYIPTVADSTGLSFLPETTLLTQDTNNGVLIDHDGESGASPIQHHDNAELRSTKQPRVMYSQNFLESTENRPRAARPNAGYIWQRINVVVNSCILEIPANSAALRAEQIARGETPTAFQPPILDPDVNDSTSQSEHNDSDVENTPPPSESGDVDGKPNEFDISFNDECRSEFRRLLYAEEQLEHVHAIIAHLKPKGNLLSRRAELNYSQKIYLEMFKTDHAHLQRAGIVTKPLIQWLEKDVIENISKTK